MFLECIKWLKWEPQNTFKLCSALKGGLYIYTHTFQAPGNMDIDDVFVIFYSYEGWNSVLCDRSYVSQKPKARKVPTKGNTTK